MLNLNKFFSYSFALFLSFSLSLFLTFALCFVLIGQHAKIGCTNEWNEGAYLRARGAFVLKRSEREREDETLFLVDLGQSSALQRGAFLHGSKRNRRWHIETNQSSPAHGEVQQTNSRHTDLSSTRPHASFLWHGVCEVRGLFRGKALPQASASSAAAQRIQLKYRGRDPRSQQQELISLNFCLSSAQILLVSAL